MKNNSSFSGTLFLPLSFLLITSFLSYSNSFTAAWHLDDIPNILFNESIHIDSLDLKSLLGSLFANPTEPGRLYRPIPCLTFAVNWYFGQYNPFGYHVLNYFIHLANALLLYLTIRALFHAPALKNRYSIHTVTFIALTCSALWTLHPIQTQAVTYIVQRMALLAGFFSILGFYFYLRFRLVSKGIKRYSWISGCVLCFFAAIGSKENAFLFPLNLFLIEVIFFQNLAVASVRKKMLTIAGILLVALSTVGFLIFMKSDFFSKLNEPGIRYFTPIERLLTQPRVILFYISQLFFPYPARFSMEHDFDVSKSLFEPWTTLPAIILSVFMILLGIRQMRQHPILSFAILFFFVNHSIESSFLPLELLFEHRNYLPSMFFFVPISSALGPIFDKDRKRSISRACMVVGLTTLSLIFLGWATYNRNESWQTKRSLLLDSAQKAPGQARPLAILASDISPKKENEPLTSNQSYKLLEKALQLSKPRKEIEADILDQMAMLHHEWRDYDTAFEFYKQAIHIAPNTAGIQLNMIKTLIQLEKWDQALQQINFLISIKESYPDYLHIKGILLLWMNQTESGLECLRKAYRLDPNQSGIHFNIGVALSKLGSYANSKWFLKLAAKETNENILPILALIDLGLRNQEISESEKYTHRLFSQHSLQDILSTLQKLPRNFGAAPIYSKRIQAFIQQQVITRTDRFFSLNHFNRHDSKIK